MTVVATLRGLSVIGVVVSIVCFAGAAGADGRSVDAAPLALGPFPVACSDVAYDANFISQNGGNAADYWEGNPGNGQPRYLTDVLLEPQQTIRINPVAPDDGNLYPQTRTRPVPFVVLVCYPTSADNVRADYPLPNATAVPKMQRSGQAPIFPAPLPAPGVPPGNSDRLPLLVMSHGLAGSPLDLDMLDAITRLASFGYIVAAPFHGDARFSVIHINNIVDLISVAANFDHFIEMQALRPVALKATVDALLLDPDFGPRIDPTKIGGFGASMGGASMTWLLGAWLTNGFSSQSAHPTVQDARVKAVVGYVPYAGEHFLPAFGQDNATAINVATPYLAIVGTADTIAPMDRMQQAMNLFQSSRYMVTLAGVPHGYDSSYAGDVFGWAIPFLDAYVKGDTASLDKFLHQKVVLGGLDDQVVMDVTVPPSNSPATGLWVLNAENNGQSGRGFQVETHNGIMVLTYYGYLAGGHDHWYLAAGSLANGAFSAGMSQYQGGTALGASYAPATANGSAGTVALRFTSPTAGSITLPGEAATAISKFGFGGGGSPTVVPSNGLWVIDAEHNGQSGRGFQIEQNGGVLVFTYYGYDATGNETWYLASGSMNGNTFTSSLTEYNGGTVLGAAYAAAVVTGSPGQVTIGFATPTTGTITLPGEAARAISKFSW
jgi:dienelactone hydrolase